MFLLKRVILLLCFPIVLEQTIIPFFVNIINIYLGIHNRSNAIIQKHHFPPYQGMLTWYELQSYTLYA